MEMGRRDAMRRGGGTNKQQSGSGYTGKSKKRMLKKLGLADDNVKRMKSYEFLHHHHPSDLENEVSRKIPKLPKKNLKGTSGVDHASVPRKLRSAMKKRNLESVSKLSSVSKRLNRSKTGSESFDKELVKKENQEMETKAIVPESMMISKDEKEVAETLYGLAGMFTETEAIDKKKTCHEKETSKLDSILVVKPDYTQAESLEPAVSVLSSAKTNQTDEKPLVQSDNQLSVTGMVDFINRLKQSSSVNVTDAPARATEIKVATSDTDYRSNGLLALWPGLSSTVRSGAQVLSKPLSTKLPPWMDQAASPSKTVSLLSEPLRVQPRKLKRCASHIYISRLIKVLQTSKSSPTSLDQIEQRPSEMSEHRLPDPVTNISDFKTMVSPAKRYQNPHLLDIHRTHNSKPVLEDRTQLALDLNGPHTTQKQSYDFLTLSSAGATQSHFQLPNSIPQYLSAAYNRQLSPATSSHQVHQLSPYLVSRFQTAYNANQQQQQQLQKRLWAAQYRPTNGNTMQSNQYIQPNLSLNLTSIQQTPQIASSPRYQINNNVSQQKHHLMAAAAAMSISHHHNNNNPSRMVMNRQEHHFPLIYEDTRTPLQLLCNEQ